MFTPIGPVANGERLIILDSVVIMLAIVIPTILATVVVAWWFRASNRRAKRDPSFVYSGRVELVVWSIPALTILFLGSLAWISAHDLDPAKPLKSNVQPLDVEVVAMDWKWLFIYPTQGVATINRLVAPTGTPLRMHLTSATVMNTLFAPEVGSQIYVMNGMVGTMWWQVDRTGTYFGQSNMFSGDGFPGMRFEVAGVSPAQFDAWVAATRGRGPALDETGYRALLKQSSDLKPYAYGSVAPGLFDAIVQQKLPPGEGPVQAGNKNPFVRPVRSP
ncbi:MAG: COX aromatic rich motif-containing protein [Caulobacteraceae bacterium]|nr:COX aromatic rich motif-containing protein [Caulobacteraceae bacterium]